MAYSLGACPVCPGAGEVIALRTRTTGRLVFYCPTCGTAWEAVPDPDTLDEVNRLEELAPDGVVLAVADDLRAKNLDREAKETDEFDELLREVL